MSLAGSHAIKSFLNLFGGHILRAGFMYPLKDHIPVLSSAMIESFSHQQ